MRHAAQTNHPRLTISINTPAQQIERLHALIVNLQVRVLALEKPWSAIKLKNNNVKSVANAARELCCRTFKIKDSEFRSKNRSERIAWPRQIAMLLTYEISHGSLQDVANEFHFDHTNVLHARQRVLDRIETEARARQQFEYLKGELRKIFTEENWI